MGSPVGDVFKNQPEKVDKRRNDIADEDMDVSDDVMDVSDEDRIGSDDGSNIDSGVSYGVILRSCMDTPTDIQRSCESFEVCLLGHSAHLADIRDADFLLVLTEDGPAPLWRYTLHGKSYHNFGLATNDPSGPVFDAVIDQRPAWEADYLAMMYSGELENEHGSARDNFDLNCEDLSDLSHDAISREESGRRADYKAVDPQDAPSQHAPKGPRRSVRLMEKIKSKEAGDRMQV